MLHVLYSLCRVLDPFALGLVNDPDQNPLVSFSHALHPINNIHPLIKTILLLLQKQNHLSRTSILKVIVSQSLS